jgi:hypothetical protein
MSVSAVLAFSVAVSGGCAGVTGATKTAGSTPATSAAASPREALAASVPGDATPGFRFALAGDEMPLSGVVQPAAHAYRMGFSQRDPKLGFTMMMDFLVVQQQSWTKIGFKDTKGLTGLPKLPKQWMLMDPAKVKGTDVPLAYDHDADPGNTGVLFASIVDVRQTAPGRFAGTVDLTKASKADFVDAATLTALGDKAKSTPFEAAVDGKGRLTSLAVKVPAAGKTKAATYTVAYSEYGGAPALAKPAAGEQQPAPAAAYEMMNG